MVEADLVVARNHQVRVQVVEVQQLLLHRRPVVHRHRPGRPGAARETGHVVGQLQEAAHTALLGRVVPTVKALHHTKAVQHRTVATTADRDTGPRLVLAEELLRAAGQRVAQAHLVEPLRPAVLRLLAVAVQVVLLLRRELVVRSVAHQTHVLVAFGHRRARHMRRRVRVRWVPAPLHRTGLLHVDLGPRGEHRRGQRATLLRRGHAVQIRIGKLLCAQRGAHRAQRHGKCANHTRQFHGPTVGKQPRCPRAKSPFSAL